MIGECGRLAGGLGEHHEITVEIPDPDLTMASIRIHMDIGHHLSFSVPNPRDQSVEVVDLEPEGYAVAGRLVRVPDAPVVMPNSELMQLHHKVLVYEELLVFRAPMAAGGTQHPLIPKAGPLDVRDGDQRLWTDGRLRGLTHGYRLGRPRLARLLR
jgi:hypothetical protein